LHLWEFFGADGMSSSREIELDVRLAFAEVLRRLPSANELRESISAIEAGEIALSDLRAQMQSGSFFYVTHTTGYHQTVTYHREPDVPIGGPLVGNGKVGFVPAPMRREWAGSVVLGFKSGSQGVMPDTVSTFNACGVALAPSQPGDRVALIDDAFRQELFMDTAVFRTTSTYNSGAIRVEVSALPLRQYPYAIMQQVTVTWNPTAASTPPPFVTLHHILRPPQHTAGAPTYTNEIIASAGIGRLFLSGQVPTNDGTQHSSASTYLADESPDAALFGGVQLLGDNLARNVLNVPLSPDGVATVHIISAYMTSADHANPAPELRRMLMNMVRKEPSDMMTVSAADWSSLWRTGISIVAKDQAPQPEQVNYINAVLRMQLFTLFCAVREEQAADAGLSILDPSGELRIHADIACVPLLCMLRPGMARALVNFRVDQLAFARNLAASYGRSGALYPTPEDTAGYLSAPNWQRNTFIGVWTTALATISAWNYFRATEDRDWLERRGYTLIKESAALIASTAVESSPGVFVMPRTLTLAAEIVDNDTFSNYVCRVAIRYAVESSYLLGYHVPERWIAVEKGLTMNSSYNGPQGQLVLQPYQGYADGQLKLLDSMLVFHPYFAREFFGSYLNYRHPSVDYNIDRLEPKAAPVTRSDAAINTAIVATCRGTTAQKYYLYEERLQRINQFEDALVGIVRDYVRGPWLQPGTGASPPDISAGCMILLAIVTAVVGLRITGQVTQGRFVSEVFGVKSMQAQVQPPAWKQVTVDTESRRYTVVNQMMVQDARLLPPLDAPLLLPSRLLVGTQFSV
jgi:protein-glucosylgalactosylhydroxylysine glucosidase